jgi:Flp pilus assembly pilin Flp
MKKFLMTVAHFRRNDEGVTLVEYGIAITLAIVLGVGALSTLAGSVGSSMGVAGDSMITVAPASP